MTLGPNYKAAYCLSVCPAGEDVIGPFKADRKGFLNEIVKPLQEKEETIYVVPRSDAEDFVKRRFPHKKVKQVRGSLLPSTIKGFLSGMQHTFQRGQSEGLNAVFHFTFTGKEPKTAAVVIRDKTIRVADGHEGTADLHLTADKRDMARLLGEGAQPVVGTAATTDSHQGIAEAPRCLRQVLPVLIAGGRTVVSAMHRTPAATE